jgi:hypothetical protein
VVNEIHMETNVYVFQTSVRTEEEILSIKDEIDRLPGIKHWNFDLRDPGLRVFRIEAEKNVSGKIISLFRKFNFKCIELRSENEPYFTRNSENTRVVNRQLFKRGIIMLLLSGLVFWIGAFTPPYKQWMTSSTTEYLTIISNNTANWYAMHAAFAIGVIGSLSALLILSVAFKEDSGRSLLTLAATIYGVGTVLILINFAFRLTVTHSAAKHLIESKQLEPNFQAWMDWSNVLFAVYMMAGYFSCFCLGLAFRTAPVIPKWVTYLCLYFGGLAMVLYPVGLVLFEPPLMVHLPFIVSSIGVLSGRQRASF